MYVKDLTEEQWEFVRNEYQKGEMTVVAIAMKVNIHPSTLSRKAKERGISKSRKTVWNEANTEWLKNNYNLKYSDLEKHLGLNQETIRVKLLELDIERNSNFKSNKIDMTDEEFLLDLQNTSLTAPEIVRKYKEKYGISDGRIHQLRRKMGIKIRLDSVRRESSAEKAVREVLDELDLTYFKELKVGKYHVDFYLGQRLCIEVQGDYWHKLPKVVASDKRKRKFLKEQGYKILYIWESEIPNARRMIIDYLEEKGFPLLRSSDKNHVNASKSGVRLKRRANDERRNPNIVPSPKGKV